MDETLLNALAVLLSFCSHDVPAVELARFLLTLEEHLRLQGPVQQLFHVANESGVCDWIRLTHTIKTYVLTEIAGFSDLTVGGLFLAAMPNEYPELKQLAGYLRYNRQRPCDVPLNTTPVPDAGLVDVRTRQHLTLHALLHQSACARKPLVLVAGSLT
jgi:hypothetical protein